MFGRKNKEPTRPDNITELPDHVFFEGYAPHGVSPEKYVPPKRVEGFTASYGASGVLKRQPDEEQTILHGDMQSMGFHSIGKIMETDWRSTGRNLLARGKTFASEVFADLSASVKEEAENAEATDWKAVRTAITERAVKLKDAARTITRDDIRAKSAQVGLTLSRWGQALGLN